MFKLAGQYEFPDDPSTFWFAARVVQRDDINFDLRWDLILRSASIKTSLLQAYEQERAGFGINCSELTFDIGDWKELSGRKFKIALDLTKCGFYFGEHEDMVALELHFGAILRNQIEIMAVGIGLVEHASEVFPRRQVDFSIHTWVEFRGVVTNVPLNTHDPISYSKARVKYLLPQYVCLPPQIIETKYEGQIYAIEVLHAPALSSNL